MAERCGFVRDDRSPASPRGVGRGWAIPRTIPKAGSWPGPGVLLERYGVLTREVVALEPVGAGLGELAPLLARAEWRGELRRGYFVEGLSGVQYAAEEAAAELARLAAQPEPASPVILVSTVDPANLYGAGAPLDVELLDGGVARLPRISGNFLAIRDGRPGPDRRSVRQASDRAPLGIRGRHRFRTEASPQLNRARLDAS